MKHVHHLRGHQHCFSHEVFYVEALDGFMLPFFYRYRRLEDKDCENVHIP